MTRAARGFAWIAYWTAPSLFCLLLYWPILRTWFQADDFAWLSLGMNIHGWRDVVSALFTPYAQGTIRPWSDRAFFLLFYGLFGLNPLPFRIFVFLTQFANLFLIAAITRRITGSAAAGFLAATFWVANNSMVEVLGWTSVYNQAMCAFFMLLAFHFLLRYIETGRTRFWIWQWLVFLLGFGALEINVVYPALAAAYTWLCARKYFLRTLPLFLASIAFVIIHALVAPLPTSGAYAMRFNSSMLRVLATYWTWAVGTTRMELAVHVPPWLLPASVALLTVALLSFAAWNAARGKFISLFFLCWFVITVAPLLPFVDHLTEYYPYLPGAGLAMLGGWAFVSAWRKQGAWKAVAVVLAFFYMAANVPEAGSYGRWQWRRCEELKRLLLGVERARTVHPGKAILLEGIDETLFWRGIVHHPFHLLGVNDVYLAPGTEQHVSARPEGDIQEFLLPPGPTRRALDHDELVVYAAGGPRLKNITTLYAKRLQFGGESPWPRRVDAANPLMAYLLGPTWHDLAEHNRWMPKSATLQIGGPLAPGQKLYVHGYCSKLQTQSGPLQMTVSVDGAALPPVEIAPGQIEFQFAFPLPDTVVGKDRMEVGVEVNRTVRAPGDVRELGVSFGTFEVR